jgi:large subunit ribosomal protein L20
MSRSTTGKIHRRRSNKVFKDTKGFIGGRGRLFRTAKDARRKSLQNSYKTRRLKKRDFRALWIIRINAAARMFDIYHIAG